MGWRCSNNPVSIATSLLILLLLLNSTKSGTIIRLVLFPKMDSKQSKRLCVAFQHFILLSQIDSSFLKKGSNLPFKKKVLATIESFQEHSESIENFLARGETEKEKEEEEDSGYDELFEIVVEKQTHSSISLSKKYLWQQSSEHYLTATKDQQFATWSLKNLENHEPHEQMFYAVIQKFHESVEKYLKCFWMLNELNTTRLIHLMKTSTRGEELTYYHSHDLTLLAKGIQMQRGS